jgi:hypothetical protein
MIFSSSPGDVLLSLLDDLGLKVGFPVPRDIEVDLAELGFNSFGGVAVSGVIRGLGLLIVFFEAQMVGQLPLEERFNDLFAGVPHEGVKIVQGFDALLLKQFFQFVPVKSQIKPPCITLLF